MEIKQVRSKPLKGVQIRSSCSAYALPPSYIIAYNVLQSKSSNPTGMVSIKLPIMKEMLHQKAQGHREHQSAYHPDCSSYDDNHADVVEVVSMDVHAAYREQPKHFFEQNTVQANHRQLVENAIDAVVFGCSVCEAQQCDGTVGPGGG